MWTAKEDFPDLSDSKLICFDVETNDPNLIEMGPGTIRKDGYICGFSVATDGGFKNYYPIRHKGGGNLPSPDKAIAWLKKTLSTPDIPKLGANILYDAEWVKSDFGIEVMGPWWDVQIADPLLDENWPSYKLQAITQRWLGEIKDEELLYRAGVDKLKIKSSVKGEAERRAAIIGKVKAELWQLPASDVGPYGEADAALPIEIFAKQRKALEEQGLWKLFEMESDVCRLLMDMRFKGIPVDLDQAVIARDAMQKVYDKEIHKVKNRVGFIPNIWANADLVKVCDKLKIDYMRTALGNPSFEAKWLEAHEHPIMGEILKCRQYDKSGGVFIQSKIIDMTINGRVHPSYYQVKTDRGGTQRGTVSGRFSCSNPNAQQFPARNEEIARIVRSLFVAEKGCRWGLFDWSQQEPRIGIHYANILELPGAAEAVELYKKDVNTDYHDMVAAWVYGKTYTKTERDLAKQMNLAISYGMTEKTYSKTYGISLAEINKLFEKYHAKMPFIKKLQWRCNNLAKKRGHIVTIGGRHCHFNLWGPPKWDKDVKAMRREEAVKKYGLPIQRYYTYKAMNRLIQGSAADMMKKAMVDCYRAGYVPNITVHDELDFADITSDKQIKEINEIMLNCIKMDVPLKLDVEVGTNWGNCELVA